MNSFGYHIILLLFTALSLPAGNFAFAKDLEVCNTCAWTSIKQAVEAAEEGDRILVRSGIYYENSITINKKISLSGKGNPVIDAGKMNGIFTIDKTDSVLIEGFILRNVEVSYRKDFAAIKVFRSNYCIIRNNSIENAFFGIQLEKSDYTSVLENKVVGEAIKEASSGNAIHLWYCNNASIEGNYLQGHRDGIYFEFVSSSVIRNNRSTGNLRYGLHFMFSDNNLYQENTFSKNGAGVAVMYSKGIEMTGNLFSDNWGAAAYGLLLKDITDSSIRRNTFSGNTIGVHAEGSNRLQVEQNTWTRNGWAFKIMGSCDEVKITENNFISNTFEVSSGAARAGSNVFDGNYWSSYTGYDLDKDGSGDVPHRPVKLFSYLLEKSPHAIVLLRSMFTDLLELAEKVTPVLTPEFIKDENPSIKIIKW